MLEEAATQLSESNIEKETCSENVGDIAAAEVTEAVQLKGLIARELSEEESRRLAAHDKQPVTEFKRNKLELDAKKNWDLFYRRNKANFFKDRFWTWREFDELNDNDTEHNAQFTRLLEVGCGVGNFMYPLLEHNKRMFVYACDFSTDAVQLVKANPAYDTTRCSAFVCNLAEPRSLTSAFEAQGANGLVDIVTLIFVLSAIHPDKMRACIDNIARVVRPGGLVFVRDYGVNDHSMIRFDPGHKLDERFYFRQDGTRTFFFTLEDIEALFLSTHRDSPLHASDIEATTSETPAATAEEANDQQQKQQQQRPLFNKVFNEYVFRETVNFKEGLRAPRVFIQSKFVRNDVKL